MNDLISIIVPVYNVEKEIDRCVDSLINQTYENIEVLLIDDGSTDKSSCICDEYAMLDDRIRVIHKENGGLSDARNCGLDNTNGDFVMFVDSDDFLETDACLRLYECIVNTDTDMCVGVIREIRKDSVNYQRRSHIKPNVRYSSKEFMVRSIKSYEWYAPAVLNLYKTAVFNDNNIRFKKGRLYEDIEILPRIYLCTNTISYVDFPFYNYVIRENSITTSIKNEKHRSSYLQNLQSWKQLFDSVDDKELQSILYGALVKQYVYAKRNFRIKGWKVDKLDIKFALKYALSNKERLKVLIVNLVS